MPQKKPGALKNTGLCSYAYSARCHVRTEDGNALIGYSAIRRISACSMLIVARKNMILCLLLVAAKSASLRYCSQLVVRRIGSN